MANTDDITNLKRELAKVLGSVYYVCTTMDEKHPTYYPLHVATMHGFDLIERLERLISQGKVADTFQH